MKILLAIAVLLIPVGARAWPPPQDAGATQSGERTPRIRLGGNVAAAKLLDKAQPVYPPLARQTRISGTVRLHAIIGKDGLVKQLEVISGHPLLVQSALDAVKKWRYAPTLLNGELVEVDTTIDVIYQLNQDAPGEGSDAPIEPQLKADILHLLEITHFRETSRANTQRVRGTVRTMVLKALPETPKREEIADAYLRKLDEQIATDDLMNQVIPVYAKYFSDEEVKAIAEFYATPAGQKFSRMLPDFMTDLGSAGARLAQQKMPAILKQLCEEYPELEGTPNVCPAEPEKKSELSMPSREWQKVSARAEGGQ